MACGAPVVASNTTSIPELVGDAGLLCDPRSPEQFADALTRVLTDAGLAGRLRRDGPERAARFTWDQTGRALAAVLEEALGA
jgi:glycosyltransferase involved in cell wall biosynthesis